MIGPRRSLRRDERGVEVIEFAIVLPILAMLIFGIVQFGLYFWERQTLVAAAREGARVAAVGGTTAQIGSAVTNAADAFTGLSYAVTVNGASSGNPPCTAQLPPDGTSTEAVTVTVSAPFAFNMPLLPQLDVHASSVGVFRCE